MTDQPSRVCLRRFLQLSVATLHAKICPVIVRNFLNTHQLTIGQAPKHTPQQRPFQLPKVPLEEAAFYLSTYTSMFCDSYHAHMYLTALA